MMNCNSTLPLARLTTRLLASACFSVCIHSSVAAKDHKVVPATWEQARANGVETQKAISFCRRYANGWLAAVDPVSGLLPRRLSGDDIWNAQDCAADNYPFIVLTAYVLDDHYLKQVSRDLLEIEQKLTNRVDELPDTFDFANQGFLYPEIDWARILFGASEYVKDGLMPMTEWMGPSPWETRMLGLMEGIWRNADTETPVGLVPTQNIEVHGELLQSMSRLYWRTGDKRFKEWTFRLADLYLLHDPLLDHESIRLRDHGCEVISGLSEAYLIASLEDKERYQKYRVPMHAILDDILEHAIDEDGMMPSVYCPRTDKVLNPSISDGWGYVYNAYLTVAEIDDVPRYRNAVAHALQNIHKYLDAHWEGENGADGYADSVEGALNLLNRLPDDSAFDWAEKSMQKIWDKQRPDGIIEGWYGDGNSARTTLMYALWKTQGVTAAPWRDDVRLGSVRNDDGALHIEMTSDWNWTGHLRFDRPRHRDWLKLPQDYPRINQFPEWFTVEDTKTYSVQIVEEYDTEPLVMSGSLLRTFPVRLPKEGTIRLTVRELPDGPPNLRALAFQGPSAEATTKWQKETRAALARVLKIDRLLKNGPPAFDAKIVGEQVLDGYRRLDIEIASTPTRRIQMVVTLPDRDQPVPAVVCIAGHGDTRNAPYDQLELYKRFGAELSKRGFATISVDVGQHEVYESGMTLLGERLWDLIRCVDYLESRNEIDSSRIGCAGLSLGGEMGMWLAGMDERIHAASSCGFLTVMDVMEQHHCRCWDTPGLRKLVDFPDIFALTAPRALQCQNGRQEPRTQFTPEIARIALRQIQPAYAAFSATDNLQLHVHSGGHEIDLSELLRFMNAHLFGVSH